MDKFTETIEMNDQEIPRNLKPEFCDNPTVSPIEYSRNSSLIENKTRVLNISFDKLVEEEDNNCVSSDQFVRPNNNEKLDVKFIGDTDEENLLNFEMEDFTYDLSFDDEDFRSNSPFFKNKKVNKI